MDEYDSLVKAPLKISKSKNKESKIPENPLACVPDSTEQIIVCQTTKAQKAFMEKQDSISQKRILEKASKTHKQRVEEFNRHLDSLSEHYDIPKVSWTK